MCGGNYSFFIGMFQSVNNPIKASRRRGFLRLKIFFSVLLFNPDVGLVAATPNPSPPLPENARHVLPPVLGRLVLAAQQLAAFALSPVSNCRTAVETFKSRMFADFKFLPPTPTLSPLYPLTARQRFDDC